jgi:GNAT superfamily N-acetyltransferase
MAATVRPVTPADDLDTLGQIVLTSYRVLPGHPHEPDYEVQLADVAARAREAVVFGAFADRVPLGCVTYVPDSTSPHAEGLRDDEAGFRMLGVAPAAQGRGTGEALVQRCLDEARGAGKRAMFIYSGDWMETAHRLYKRLGFVRVPERDWVLQEPSITLLAFRREL